jgi:hypothetical protein
MLRREAREGVPAAKRWITAPQAKPLCNHLS